jgi:glycosyltransferase involved in cell wall biosynthesis
VKRGLPFTTSLHTRFPDYLAGRLPVPERWTCDLTWAWLRRFHGAGTAVLAATPTLGLELIDRGFKNVKLWPRGVDAQLFRPRPNAVLDLPRPIFLTVGRVALEKSRSVSLAGNTKLVGDGRLAALWRRLFRYGLSRLARWRGACQIYAAADVFVFPSRTDTFGLVLLEALASGVPVAGFPTPRRAA